MTGGRRADGPTRRRVVALAASAATAGCLGWPNVVRRTDSTACSTPADTGTATTSDDSGGLTRPPTEMLGGGSVTGNDVRLTDRRAGICAEYGCSGVRLALLPPYYYSDDEGETRERRIEENVLRIAQHGLSPTVLFEYYVRYGVPLGGYDKWYDIGATFARRYRPNSQFLRDRGIEDWGITRYMAFNEPDIEGRIEKARYRDALEGLADGVHSVDESLDVVPGGWAMPSAYDDYTAQGYAPAVADLLNDGTLSGINLHIYFDAGIAPMDGSYEHSAQSNFDRLKEASGITADPDFYCDEFNQKVRVLDRDAAAKNFLTAIWDALGVVGDDGTPVTQIAFPYNIFHTVADDELYGLLRSRDPFEPSQRGRVLERVLGLVRGTRLVEADPKTGGEYRLDGCGKRLWVWQNRAAWTDSPGTTYTVEGIPAAATRLELHGYDGHRRTDDVGGRQTYEVTGLEPGETYLFLAEFH